MDQDKKARLKQVFIEATGSAPMPEGQMPSIIIGAGATVIIGDNNHHAAQPPAPDAISDKQCRWLRSLVSQIVEKERKTKPGFSSAKVWTRINGVMGVSSYKDIPKGDFDRAKNYLEAWLRNS